MCKICKSYSHLQILLAPHIGSRRRVAELRRLRRAAVQPSRIAASPPTQPSRHGDRLIDTPPAEFADLARRLWSGETPQSAARCAAGRARQLTAPPAGWRSTLATASSSSDARNQPGRGRHANVRAHGAGAGSPSAMRILILSPPQGRPPPARLRLARPGQLVPSEFSDQRLDAALDADGRRVHRARAPLLCRLARGVAAGGPRRAHGPHRALDGRLRRGALCAAAPAPRPQPRAQLGGRPRQPPDGAARRRTKAPARAREADMGQRVAPLWDGEDLRPAA